jgi:hypothetical protein
LHSLLADPDAEDIIDEALNLFRANVLFRNFEIKGDADRVLIYLILFITECLGKLARNPSLREAEKILGTLALGNFAIPGDATFPLNALYTAPANKMDAGTCCLFFIVCLEGTTGSVDRATISSQLIYSYFHHLNARFVAPIRVPAASGDGCQTPQPHL